MLRQMTPFTAFALPWASSLHFSIPRSEMREHNKPRPEHGQQSIMSTPQSISMPGTTAPHGMHTSGSRICPVNFRSYRRSARRISGLIQQSSEEHRWANGISNCHGFGVLEPLSNRVENGWMTVSSSYHLYCRVLQILMNWIVNRVHWLRAKAQLERWKEEQDSVHNEAVWIPAYFRTKAVCWKKWMQMATQAKLPGHEAYASCQAHAWEEMCRSSIKALIPITSATNT